MIMEKKHIYCCSMGKDSLAQIILAHTHTHTIDEIIYCEVMYDKDISGEVPEHRDFIYNIAIPMLKKWGYKVTVLRANTNYVDYFYKPISRGKRKGMLRGFPLCGMCGINRDCKIPPIKKYLKKFKGCDIIEYVGIASDEQNRLNRLKGTNKVSLLEQYNYTESMARDLCKQYGLLSPIYEFTNRNGCWFCPNCKEAEWINLYTHHHDLFIKLVDLGETQNRASNLFNRNETIKELYDRIKGEINE